MGQLRRLVYNPRKEMKMKVTGYMLREAIKQHELRRDTAASAFDGSLKKFPGEEKEAPGTLVEKFLAAEEAIAKLQTAQMRYNLAVIIELPAFTGLTAKLTLAEAIKTVGGRGRAEKMWRSAANPNKKDRYGYHDDEMDPTRVRAVATIKPSEAMAQATQAGKRAGSLRAAIATANAKEVEIEDLSPALFE
jgi:hypothetical protein